MKKLLFFVFLFVLASNSYGQLLDESIKKSCVNTKFYIGKGYIRVDDVFSGQKRVQETYAWELDPNSIRVGEFWGKGIKSVRIFTVQKERMTVLDQAKVFEVMLTKEGKILTSRMPYIDLQLKPNANPDQLIKDLKFYIAYDADRYKEL